MKYHTININSTHLYHKIKFYLCIHNLYCFIEDDVNTIEQSQSLVTSLFYIKFIIIFLVIGLA